LKVCHRGDPPGLAYLTRKVDFGIDTPGPGTDTGSPASTTCKQPSACNGTIEKDGMKGRRNNPFAALNGAEPVLLAESADTGRLNLRWTYTWSSGWSLTATADSTYDWKGDQWTIPLGLFAGKVTKVSGQLVQFGVGPRYYADSAQSEPHGWGLRAIVVLIFPK